MTSSMTRGHLPASVYWRRRLAVIGTLVVVVIAGVRTFGGGDGGSDDGAGGTVTQVAATSQVTYGPSVPAAPVTSTAPTVDPTPAADPTPTAPATPELPQPTGHCSDDDVVVTAAVPDPQATKPVIIDLTLRTEIATACLWEIGPETVQLRITSGKDRIWSTIECPKAVPDRILVLRRETPVDVKVKWSSRRSDDECSSHTAWAKLGFYHVVVSPLGGEPTDLQFELVVPHADPTPPPVDPASQPPATDPATAPATTPATDPATAATEPATGTKKGKKRVEPSG